MIIKRLTIKDFGKIHNKSMELSPGMNVLYGENESGKTTVHTFIKSMFYGIQRQRGRAARNDVYSTYEPWNNPASYGGILWFENGGKSFRLTRQFYKADPGSELFCENDSEILDVEQGDLDAVLGGISEAVYENTVSVAQLKSVTGADLVREVQNYMASYQGTGDNSVDLGRAMQMLKMTRKGYQVQSERRKKELEKEQGKIEANMEYLRREIGELQDQQDQIEEKVTSLHMQNDENGVSVLDERIEQVRHKKKKLMLASLATVLLTVLGAAAVLLLLPEYYWISFAAGAVGVIALITELLNQKRLSLELNKRIKLKHRWLNKQEKLEWSRDNLTEAQKEKVTAFTNLTAEYQELQEQAFIPGTEELEIEALNYAMKTIESLSGNIHTQVGGKLKRRTSQILSEITGGKYSDVIMDAQLHITVNASDRVVPLESLSRGTIEQIYFALRMAAGELLCGSESFPVILDDVFGMYDEDRLRAVLRWLSRQNRQVIISTCHRREMEILESEGIVYQKLFL